MPQLTSPQQAEPQLEGQDETTQAIPLPCLCLFILVLIPIIIGAIISCIRSLFPKEREEEETKSEPNADQARKNLQDDCDKGSSNFDSRCEEPTATDVVAVGASHVEETPLDSSTHRSL